VRAAGHPDDGVRTWVAGVLAVAYDARLLRRARLFGGEQGALARRFPDEVEHCLRLQRAPLVELIAAARYPRADPERDALAIHHLCAGLLADRLAGTSSFSRDAAVALAAGAALQILHADGAERRPR
jgi:hypothetical protein